MAQFLFKRRSETRAEIDGLESFFVWNALCIFGHVFRKTLDRGGGNPESSSKGGSVGQDIFGGGIDRGIFKIFSCEGGGF